jgi:FAD/FMN-containing dehydrogenase
MIAFDELRFGPQRTLNLREGLPSAAQAVRRAEQWLREQQVRGSPEVLIITGRGNQSIGGVAVIRAAVEKLLFSLKRRGIVAGHAEHNPGAFAVQLASLRTLAEAPRRNRERAPSSSAAHHPIAGLSEASAELLRALAELSLHALGVTPTFAAVDDEMQRHLRVLGPGLPVGRDLDRALQAALRAAIAEYD